jgi:hypothetical protein
MHQGNINTGNSTGGGFRGRKICHNIFEEIISLENLFLAWQEFRCGKRKKPDVQEFEFNLEDNLFQLHFELKNKKSELENKLISEESFHQSLQSYLGVLKHCNGYKIRKAFMRISGRYTKKS